MKSEKMKILYYVELTLDYAQYGEGFTSSAMPKKYIVAAGTPKEAKEMVETKNSRGDDRVTFNFKLNVRKIGLTNNKKGVMFSWIC